MTFALEIEQFVHKAGDRADVAVSEIVTGLVRTVDRRSPVGDPTTWKHPAPKGYVGGRFRANNQLGVDVQFTGTLDRPDPTGAATVTANLGRIPEQAAGHVYWISNNLPYARRIEYEGWSRQAPQGVYGLTVRDFQGIVDKAVQAAEARVP